MLLEGLDVTTYPNRKARIGWDTEGGRPGDTGALSPARALQRRAGKSESEDRGNKESEMSSWCSSIGLPLGSSVGSPLEFVMNLVLPRGCERGVM